MKVQENPRGCPIANTSAPTSRSSLAAIFKNLKFAGRLSGAILGYVNLLGKVDVAPNWSVEGSAHVRLFNQQTQDGNPTGTQPCADPALLCFGNDMAPANGLNGGQLSNPFSPADEVFSRQITSLSPILVLSGGIAVCCLEVVVSWGGERVRDGA